MFCIKICFLEPELVGAGTEKKYLEPEPRKHGSAPQHWLNMLLTCRFGLFLLLMDFAQCCGAGAGHFT